MGGSRPLAGMVPGRRWAPYALVAGTLYLGAFLFGALGGTGEAVAPILPVRGPGDPVLDIETVSLFVHNLDVTVRLAGGCLLFGVLTVHGLGLNGFVHGSVFQGAVENLGLGQTLLLFLPHGVVELPALWLGSAVSFRVVHYVWKVANGNRDRTTFPRLLGETLALLGVVVLMLFVAAVVEANVTVALA